MIRRVKFLRLGTDREIRGSQRRFMQLTSTAKEVQKGQTVAQQQVAEGAGQGDASLVEPSD